MAQYSAFGTLPFGYELFGGVIKEDDKSVNKRILRRLIMRYPHGLVWRGENLLALETAFADEFAEIETEIKKSAILNKTFLFSIKPRYISLPFIENELRAVFGDSVEVFNSWGGKNYRELPASRANQFNISQYGGGQQANAPAGTFKSQFSGLGNYQGWNAFKFINGFQYNGGTIRHIVSTLDNSQEEFIFNSTPKNNNFMRRFFFFIGGSGSREYENLNNYDSPVFMPLDLPESQYLEFRKAVLRLKPLNMFVICNLNILQEV